MISACSVAYAARRALFKHFKSDWPLVRWRPTTILAPLLLQVAQIGSTHAKIVVKSAYTTVTFSWWDVFARLEHIRVPLSKSSAAMKGLETLWKPISTGVTHVDLESHWKMSVHVISSSMGCTPQIKISEQMCECRLAQPCHFIGLVAWLNKLPITPRNRHFDFVPSRHYIN